MQSGQTYVERVTAEDEDDAIAIIERYQDKDFSFTDASSFVVMQRLETRVALAFDRHFVQFGFAKATG